MGIRVEEDEQRLFRRPRVHSDGWHGRHGRTRISKGPILAKRSRGYRIDFLEGRYAEDLHFCHGDVFLDLSRGSRARRRWMTTSIPSVLAKIACLPSSQNRRFLCNKKLTASSIGAPIRHTKQSWAVVAQTGANSSAME